MYLRALEIKNYRSLEYVELDRLGNFNILIGRNNSGKSSVFGALSVLNNVIHGEGVEWETVPTARDMTRPLELRLLFEARPQDRDQFIHLVGSQLDDRRRDEMRQSPLFRQVEFTFLSDRRSGPPAVHHVRLLAEDGKWAVIVAVDSQARPRMSAVDIRAVANTARPLEYSTLHVEHNNSRQDLNLDTAFMATMARSGIEQPDEPLRWLSWRLGRYLSQAFFFNPFRHSAARLPAQHTGLLAQNGENLAQVLHTINSNDRRTFSKIEEFLHAALPDIGVLQTPLIGNNTEVAFDAQYGNYRVRLHEMGGGIEQLLMVATVLLTTGDEATIFLEEPESHLHAGAQRFLNEKLYAGGRQVFISTHSPTFINSPHRKSMYQVKLDKGRTSVIPINNADALGEALEDIGSRNSDVLLSDAVLFVEGPADQRVFEVWSEKLGISLEEHNITVVPMGGGEEAARGARVRSDVLEGISKKAPVPHMFVLDRDERGKGEVAKLQITLGGHAHILQRRELENYLLTPRALLAALRSKHVDNATLLEKITAASEKEVENLISTSASSLYGVVLVKRIRTEIAGLRGGLLPRDSVTNLAHRSHEENFPQTLQKEIESRLFRHLTDLDIDKIVRAERESLEEEWADAERRLCLAPGDEIVSAVYHHFGSEYRKPNDTARIAREMEPSEIAAEISDLLKRIIAMAASTRVNETS